MGEFVNGTFNQDCIDFARAEKAEKDAAAQAAADAKAQAEADAKAAKAAADAAADEVNAALVADVSTGPSVEEQIKDLKKEYEINKFKKSKIDDTSS
jgi:hypothetical protein